jgi:predicted RNA-binding Zn-ribbon protein involved in translation (DUF1610 family)
MSIAGMFGWNMEKFMSGPALDFIVTERQSPEFEAEGSLPRVTEGLVDGTRDQEAARCEGCWIVAIFPDEDQMAGGPCPKCGRTLTPGKVRVSESTRSLFLGWAGRATLDFRAIQEDETHEKTESPAVSLMERGDVRDAYRCPVCGIVMVIPRIVYQRKPPGSSAPP